LTVEPLAIDLSELAPVVVTLCVGAPNIPLGPEDTGGKGRWWIREEDRRASCRGADGRKGRAKRAPLPNRGFVPLGPDPRRTAIGPVTFDAPLHAGTTYILGVGVGNRLTFKVPYDLAPGSVVTIEPTSPGDAHVTWSTPSSDAPF
jgi:hypothetical protein